MGGGIQREVAYRLCTFADRRSALAEGYAVTQRHHCGTCSSLRDLAVYLETPDLTAPARTCARRWTAGHVGEAAGFNGNGAVADRAWGRREGP